jgi:TPR repeat protein
MRYLGQAYEFSAGVESEGDTQEDEAQALRWYRRAARAGDAISRRTVRQLTAPPTPLDDRPVTVEIRIKLEGDGFPSEEELELRHHLEDMLDEEQVGEFYGAGGGRGEMDVAVGVEDFPTAVRQIRLLLHSLGVLDLSGIEPIDSERLE